MSANDESTITDESLLELLSHALQVNDPVPDHVLAAAKGAVAWRTIDQDLAELVFDSALEATGVRDRDIARQLTFRADDVEVELMLVDTEPRRLVGQVVPAATTTVRLESTSAVAEQESDKYGRFTFDQVAAGPVRISIRGSEGRPGVLTDWVLL
jgi:hypothetical protein